MYCNLPRVCNVDSICHIHVLKIDIFYVIYLCEYDILSCVVLKINYSYLMVSSVVGFYSSPLFTSLLPRAQDTNLTEVPDS